jgi:hypothetical protein
VVYVPVDRGTFKKLGEIEGLAIFKSFSGTKQWAIVPEDGRFQCQLAGDHFGLAVPIEPSGREAKGLCHEQIHIEVDDESLFDTNQMDLPKGAIIRTVDGIGLVSEVFARHMREGAVLNLRGDVGDTHSRAFGFSQWRILIDENGKRVPILEIKAGEPIGCY